MSLSNNYKILIFFALYFVFRILIVNFNSAEWGDSYRILRATAFLENNSYPKDEKRPPLFSYFLTIAPNSIDPVTSARYLMVVVSVLTVMFFWLVVQNINIDLNFNEKLGALALFSFNPLFVYWSMRVYADTFFLLIALIVFYLFLSFQKNQSYFKLVLMSFFCFLGVMTRFEGYLLISAITLGFIFNAIKERNFAQVKYLSIYLVIGFSLFFWAINTPETFFKNPLSSSYVDEANRRQVGVFDILGFFLHLIFILGNLFAVFFYFLDRKKLYEFFQNNFFLLAYLAFGIILGLAWPAAIPRLLIQVVPILIILFVLGLSIYFSSRVSFPKKYFLIFPILLISYLGGQFLIRSQFLLTNYYFMFAILLVSSVQFYFIYKRKSLQFILSLGFGVVLWMFFFISLHRDIYKVLNIGVTYFSNVYQKDGVIVTNDVSYLTKFYFGDNLKYLREVDFGIDIKKFLEDRNARYIIVTNEHNPNMEYTPEKYPYLEVIFEHREEVNGRDFFVVISKVNLP